MYQSAVVYCCCVLLSVVGCFCVLLRHLRVRGVGRSPCKFKTVLTKKNTVLAKVHRVLTKVNSTEY